MSLVVSELFGPTIQGEGPSAGRPATFLRLGRCNLDCSFCDTPYTWDWSGKNGTVYEPSDLLRMEVADVVESVIERGADRLVITGGEPLLQASKLIALADALPDTIAVEVETNGTLAPPLILSQWQWNVSPKLANSGVDRDKRRTDALWTFAEWAKSPPSWGSVCFKFVVCKRLDLAEIDQLVAGFGLTNIWLMPEGRTPAQLDARLGWIADAAIERGWNVTSRLHVMAWGDERGR